MHLEFAMISSKKIVALKQSGLKNLLTNSGRIHINTDMYYKILRYCDKQDSSIYSIKCLGRSLSFVYHRHPRKERIWSFGDSEEDFLSHVKENHPEFFEWMLWNLL